jgi:hypothetical protein
LDKTSDNLKLKTTTYTAKGDVNGNALEIYSTSEEVLTGGVWIDGSPIYRKVFNFGAGTQYLSLSIDFLPIENIIEAKAMGGRYITYSSKNIDNEALVFDFGIGNIPTGNAYVILEYTKNS